MPIQDRIQVYRTTHRGGSLELCPDHFNPYAGGVVRDNEACDWMRRYLGCEPSPCAVQPPGQRSFFASVDEARNLGLWPPRVMPSRPVVKSSASPARAKASAVKPRRSAVRTGTLAAIIAVTLMSLAGMLG